MAIQEAPPPDQGTAGAEERSFAGKVVWVTGGAHGIGAAVARRLSGQGAAVLVTDVDDEAGSAVAATVGGAFLHCDVSDPEQNAAAVATAVERFGGLDIAFLNAGVNTGFGIEKGFDPAAYRRVMGVNLDGVVFGVHSALPALRARGGGDIITTASMAGLTPVPHGEIYSANKAAVIGLVRSLGPVYGREGIRINAICPSYADTAIIDTVRSYLARKNVPLVEVEAIVDTFCAILAGRDSGECWYVQAGHPSAPFRFGGVPEPRATTAPSGPAHPVAVTT